MKYYNSFDNFKLLFPYYSTFFNLNDKEPVPIKLNEDTLKSYLITYFQNHNFMANMRLVLIQIYLLFKKKYLNKDIYICFKLGENCRFQLKKKNLKNMRQLRLSVSTASNLIISDSCYEV